MGLYDSLFRPIQLAGLTVPNRIVRTAHGIRSPWLDTSDRLLEYHAARARGGVGMSILGAAEVAPGATAGIPVGRDDVVPGYRRLADAVHRHGSTVIQQLFHIGSESGAAVGGIPWSASAVPHPLSHAVPIPMTQSMIREMVGYFATAAARVRDGGLDGVEIHAGSGYLIHQFLSPLTNLREDEYGGGVENRMRLLCEILDAVRAEVGMEFPVGIRLVVDEYAPGGIDPHMSAAIAELVEPRIDFLNLHHGSGYRYYKMLAPTDAEPLGYEVPASGDVSRRVTVPTIVAGRVMTLDHADDIVRSGAADMVSLVRATIADPDLVRKARAGRTDEIRPCIGTNEGCVGGILTSGFGCVVNPDAGNEDGSEPRTADRRLRILVAGAGPAGLEAARSLARAGHSVTVYEARRATGGQLRIAAAAPHRADLATVLSWWQGELTRLGVRVVLGTAVEPDLVDRAQPDVVVVATGSTPRRDGFSAGRPGTYVPGADLPHVVTSWDLFGFGGRVEPGAHTLVYDDTGTFEAVSATEYLLDRGGEVTFVTRHDTFGVNVPGQRATLLAARERLFSHPGFTLLTSSYLEQITQGHTVVRRLAHGPILEIPASTVVHVGFNTPERELAEILVESGYRGDIQLVGDAAGTRTIREAVSGGAGLRHRWGISPTQEDTTR